MVRYAMPHDPDPSSIRWCHDDDLFEANYQFARASAEQNKKDYGIDFNPRPAEPRPNGTREADPNLTGPCDNLKAYIEHLDALRTAAAAAHGEAQADDNAPASPKPQCRSKGSKAKGPKASKAATTPKASRVKPLRSAPPETSVHSKTVSRNSPKTKSSAGRGPKPTSTLRDDDDIIHLSNDDFDDDALEKLIKNKQEETDIFKDLPLFDHDILNNFIDELF
jgi:hypothetical protein